MEVVVTTGAVRRQNCYQQHTNSPTTKNWVLVCWWWWFDWSFARLIAPPPSSFASITPANPGPPGKWPLKRRDRTYQQSNIQLFTGRNHRMSLLLPNHQCQSTKERKYHIPWSCSSEAHLGATKLQTNRHHQQTNVQVFIGRMPFLSPNYQCQSMRPVSTCGRSVFAHGARV